MPISTHLLRIGVLGAALLPALTPMAYAETESTPPATTTLDRDIPALLRGLRTAPPPIEKAADGTVVPQTITTPSGKKLTLQFHDEFEVVPDEKKDGQPYIDRRKWQTTFWQGSSVRTLGDNGEAQYYMDRDYAGKNNIPLDQRPNPFSFEKPGVLTISAFKTPRELWGNYWMGEQRPFTSGLLISDKRFVFQYGYVEGRFKLPNNRGAWPGFWMLPHNPVRSADEAKQHPWPPEIDIFESFGHRPTKFSTNIIGTKTAPVKISKFMQDMGTDITQDFHTWGLEWDEERLVYYFDGKEVARAEINDSFRQPMYLLINLAVGGNWYADEMKNAKTPFKAWEVDESTMPWKMECDYVRVYQSPDNLIPPIAPSTIPKPVTVAAPSTPPTGPKPYPDQKAWEDSVWPGKGPIRVFGWMIENRKAFWQNREKDQGAVVFAGDSQTAGWKSLAESFPNLKVANRGIGGDVSRGLLYRFQEDVLDLNPRALVILIGGNDLSTLSDPAVVEHNLGLMIDMARARNPKLPIVLCQVSPRDDPNAPIKPGALADLNARIAKVGAGRDNCVVIDLFTPFADADGKPKAEYFGKDRLHMAPPAYKVWAELVSSAFEKLGVK